MAKNASSQASKRRKRKSSPVSAAPKKASGQRASERDKTEPKTAVTQDATKGDAHSEQAETSAPRARRAQPQAPRPPARPETPTATSEGPIDIEFRRTLACMVFLPRLLALDRDGLDRVEELTQKAVEFATRCEKTLKEAGLA